VNAEIRRHGSINRRPKQPGDSAPLWALQAQAERGRTAYIIVRKPAQFEPQIKRIEMPSLFRFLLVIGVLVGLCYGAIYALATFVEPTSREMTVTVPRDVLNKPR
jgi:hypothetical protein